VTHPATLQEALAAAEEASGPTMWNMMSPSEQTQAIYREMRRIDRHRALLRHFQQSVGGPRHPPRSVSP
jgi:hypothetical protein